MTSSDREATTWRRQWPYAAVLSVVLCLVLLATLSQELRDLADRAAVQVAAFVLAGIAYVVMVRLDRSPDRAGTRVNGLRWTAAILGGLGLLTPAVALAGPVPVGVTVLIGLATVAAVIVAAVSWLGGVRPRHATEL